MQLIEMTSLELRNKKVLIRADLNVPLQNGSISNDKRIQAIIPSVKYAIDAGAMVILASHLGRPKEGIYDENYSLKPVAARLSSLLGLTVPLINNLNDSRLASLTVGEVILLENMRFNIGEKNNDQALSRRMANLCDIFVMDAFATAHRKQASTYGVAEFAPQVCAGPLLCAELKALTKAMENPQRPIIAIVGGAKVSTKVNLLDALLDKVNLLIVGGGIANTFIAAQKYPVGKSLYEADAMGQALSLLLKAEEQQASIPVPTDVLVSKSISADAKAVVKNLSEIATDDIIVDIGPKTTQALCEIILQAGTIIWNGPVGIFEIEQFSQGTQALAKAIAKSDAFSLAGGGDTTNAIDKYHIANKISYISTGGGAFLQFLEGRELPAVEILLQRNQKIA